MPLNPGLRFQGLEAEQHHNLSPTDSVSEEALKATNGPAHPRPKTDSSEGMSWEVWGRESLGGGDSKRSHLKEGARIELKSSRASSLGYPYLPRS